VKRNRNKKKKMKLLKLSNFAFIEIIKEKQHNINSGKLTGCVYIH
jgi:hypothetical protein